MSDRDTAFAEYFAARSEAMRGTAYLLCGDWHRAEDLVQATFTKLYLAWRRVARHDALDAYTRQTLVRTFVSELRRGWFRKERVSQVPQDAPAPGHGSTEDRVVLLAALAKVPPRQRAVLVLRYWEDLSVQETAKALNCSEGTVKSQAARGLQTLRGLVTPQMHEGRVR
ncbi:SigE family RNA polymerase sigma factor [Saccharothrix coeruleofusca]|uniref:RNA polymerase sigma24 factor n=1 Tax=Saccharothrix coeruleofusca TaxID=33919 RepID=A0A918ECH8_9PSEU|nr:SigE family RNA polymerase sigma factor [Saccharothrix coeruleofusca]MBP2338230.1 RNA polymerase sigma-70 factor (sigma-E family) [Saccharothrix coeruleofusca]GGP49856.1 RNA polymerase sigma24 factor [Saccharothrix coeruleofusca]